MQPRHSRTFTATKALLWMVLGLYFFLGTVSRFPFLHNHEDHAALDSLVHGQPSGSHSGSGHDAPTSGQDAPPDTCLTCHWLAQVQSPFSLPDFTPPGPARVADRVDVPGDLLPFRWFAAPLPSRGPPKPASV